VNDNPTNAPRSRSPLGVKVIGAIAIIVLVVAIFLLATGIVNFEQRGIF
jgi:hypothetical protein